jgi:hypothetical protein
MKSSAMKKQYDLDLPPRRQAQKDEPKWWDLWVRIRVTRLQLVAILGALVIAVTGAYLAWNYTSMQDLWHRRRAIERIQTSRLLLAELESTAGARADVLETARGQIQQAEDSLLARAHLRSIGFAQQAIEVLEEELRWKKILETGRAAKFERIEGMVQVRRPGRNDWQTADPAMEIEAESEIRTGRDGRARIRFDNGASSDITPDSLLFVRKLGVDARNRTFENDMRLEQGEMEYRSLRRSDASQVDVPSGSFRSTGAIHVRAAHREGKGRPTSIEVLEGQGQFSDLKGNLVALPPMSRVQVDSAGTLGQARQILLAPELISPPTASSLHFGNGDPIAVTFRWTLVQGAKGYRLEVSENNRFERLLDSIATSQNEAGVSELSEGIYWWRVRSLDAEGTASDPSVYRSFRIQISPHDPDARAKGPSVGFEKAKLISRNSVLIEGKTTFGVQLFVNDQLVSIDLQGRFRDIILIKDESRLIQVEAIDPDGNNTSFKLMARP